MAMNFKVFSDANTAATYVADLMRKQFRNNPTTIVGVHLNTDDAPVLEQLKADVEKHPVNFSQVNILDYDNNKPYYEGLGVPSGQIYPVAYNQQIEEYIDEKIKSKKSKAKFTLQVVTIDRKGSLNINMKSGLLPARELLVVITGADKQDVVKNLYEQNGNTSFVPADIKAHRMINVVLDEAAAQGLPEDVRQYFTARFA